MSQVIYRLNIIFYITILILILSCNKDKEYFIDKEFELYVDSFFFDANSRGLNIKKENFDLNVSLIDLKNSDGECHFHDHTINIDKLQWQRLNYHNRRWLLYHELGHCVLGIRNHRNEVNNGQCLSIMRGKENGLSCFLNLYSSKWWNYYLDELFNKNAKFPFWDISKEMFNVNRNIKFEKNIDTISNYIDKIDVDSSLFTNVVKISVNLNNLSNLDNLYKIYFGDLGFSYCPKCSGVNIRINHDQRNQIYYENFELDFFNNQNIELSIVKWNDYISFFVNKKFIYTMESELVETPKFIKTNQLNGEIGISVKIQQYE